MRFLLAGASSAPSSDSIWETEQLAQSKRVHFGLNTPKELCEKPRRSHTSAPCFHAKVMRQPPHATDDSQQTRTEHGRRRPLGGTCEPHADLVLLGDLLVFVLCWRIRSTRNPEKQGQSHAYDLLPPIWIPLSWFRHEPSTSTVLTLPRFSSSPPVGRAQPSDPRRAEDAAPPFTARKVVCMGRQLGWETWAEYTEESKDLGGLRLQLGNGKREEEGDCGGLGI